MSKSTSSARPTAAPPADNAPGSIFWFLVGFIAFIAATATIDQGTGAFFLLLIGLSFVIAAVVSGVTALIWTKRQARTTFSIVVAICCSVLFYIRAESIPKLGIAYEDRVDGAFVGYLDPNGALAIQGFHAPLIIQAVDGVPVGLGKAAVEDVLRKHRVFDHVVVQLWGQDSLPTNVDVVLTD